MFDVYAGLRALLLADATVSGLVGTRVYPVKLPQTVTFPAITILVVSDQDQTPLADPSSLTKPRVQIDCWVRERSGQSAFKAAQTLGNAVRALMNGFVGTLTDSGSSPTITVQASARLLDKRDLFEGDADGGIHRHSADYEVFHGINGD